MSRDSKFLSLILRHKPEEIGLKLDPAGWVQLDLLLKSMKKAECPVSYDGLRILVDNNEKRRFTISEDGTLIRAAQGHSTPVDLGLASANPPVSLYHGTARHYLDSIFSDGLQPMGRQQVHLSDAPQDAEKIGGRHGKPVVLQIAALKMSEMGHVFFVADNGVWLTASVPAEFLGFWNGQT